MDKFDLQKPLCIFILDCNPDADSGLTPEQILQEYVQNSLELRESTKTNGSGNDEAAPVPCPAIRGSTLPFGGWGNPKKAVKISTFHYALTINNPIPNGSEYKWLDVSGKGLQGDIDPATLYSYEPRPYIDRPIKFRTPVPREEILIVMDRWGNYTSKIEYTRLDKWIGQHKFEEALVKINVEQDKVETATSTDGNMGNSQGTQSSHAEEYQVVEVRKTPDNMLESLESKSSETPDIPSKDILRNQKKSNGDILNNSVTPERPSSTLTNQRISGEDLNSDTDHRASLDQVVVQSSLAQTACAAPDVLCDHTSLVSIEEEVEKSDCNTTSSAMEMPVNKESEVFTHVPETVVVFDRKENISQSKHHTSVITEAILSHSETETKVDRVSSTKTKTSEVKKTRKGTTDVTKAAKKLGTAESASVTPSTSRSTTRTVTSERRVTKTTTSSVGSEPVKLRSPRAKPSERPRSLVENSSFSSSTARPLRTSGFSRNVRPFSLSADMKFSRFRRSTEEIFIERSSPKSPMRVSSSSSGSENFLASPVLLSPGEVSPGKVEDSVFDDKSESTPDDQPQGDEKLSKVVVKNVFSDMLSRARKISSDFQKKDSPDYKQSTRLHHRDYNTTNRQYGSSPRSTVTPDRYPPARHSFFSRGAAKSESSLLFGPSPDNRQGKLRETKKKERPVSTEVAVTITDSNGHVKRETFETQSHLVEEHSELTTLVCKTEKIFTESANEDVTKDNQVEEYKVESSEVNTTDKPTALCGTDVDKDASKQEEVKRQLNFGLTGSEHMSNLNRNGHGENISNTLNGSTEPLNTPSMEDKTEAIHMDLLTEEQTNNESCLQKPESAPSDDNSGKSNLAGSDLSSTVVMKSLISEATQSTIVSQEDTVESLAKNQSNGPGKNLSKDGIKENELSDKTYRAEKEIVVYNEMTSFELDDESDAQVMVAGETLEEISYTVPVAVPSIDSNTLILKPNTNNSSVVGTEDTKLPSKHTDIAASSEQVEPAKTKPRLGSTKSFKSFEESFEGEDYIVIDLPSCSSVSEEECSDGKLCAQTNFSQETEVLEDVIDGHNHDATDDKVQAPRNRGNFQGKTDNKEQQEDSSRSSAEEGNTGLSESQESSIVNMNNVTNTCDDTLGYENQETAIIASMEQIRNDTEPSNGDQKKSLLEADVPVENKETMDYSVEREDSGKEAFEEVKGHDMHVEKNTAIIESLAREEYSGDVSFNSLPQATPCEHTETSPTIASPKSCIDDSTESNTISIDCHPGDYVQDDKLQVVTVEHETEELLLSSLTTEIENNVTRSPFDESSSTKENKTDMDGCGNKQSNEAMLVGEDTAVSSERTEEKNPGSPHKEKCDLDKEEVEMSVIGQEIKQTNNTVKEIMEKDSVLNLESVDRVNGESEGESFNQKGNTDTKGQGGKNNIAEDVQHVTDTDDDQACSSSTELINDMVQENGKTEDVNVSLKEQQKNGLPYTAKEHASSATDVTPPKENNNTDFNTSSFKTVDAYLTDQVINKEYTETAEHTIIVNGKTSVVVAEDTSRTYTDLVQQDTFEVCSGIATNVENVPKSLQGEVLTSGSSSGDNFRDKDCLNNGIKSDATGMDEQHLERKVLSGLNSESISNKFDNEVATSGSSVKQETKLKDVDVMLIENKNIEVVQDAVDQSDASQTQTAATNAVEEISSESQSSNTVERPRSSRKTRGKEKRKKKEDDLVCRNVSHGLERSSTESQNSSVSCNTAEASTLCEDTEQTANIRKSYSSAVTCGRSKQHQISMDVKNRTDEIRIGTDVKPVQENHEAQKVHREDDTLLDMKPDQSEHVEHVAQKEEESFKTQEPEWDIAQKDAKRKDRTKISDATPVPKPDEKTVVKQRKGKNKGKGKKGGKRKNDQWKAQEQPLDGDEKEETTVAKPAAPSPRRVLGGRNVCLILFFVVLVITLSVGLYYIWYDRSASKKKEL